jgi:tRNA nucleotidyltransferase (CCA-adding enzyme)
MLHVDIQMYVYITYKFAFHDTGPFPYIALLQIWSLGLFDCIFAPPIEELPALPVDHLSIAILILKQMISENETSYSNLKSLMETQHDWYIGWMIASLTPWKEHVFPQIKGNKNIPAASTVACEGLKTSSKVSGTIARSYRNHSKINDFVQTNAFNDIIKRSEVGNFIRNLGADWRNQYLCALLLETIPFWKQGNQTLGPEVEEIMKKYSNVLTRINILGLTEACSLKSILDVCNQIWRSALIIILRLMLIGLMVVIGQKIDGDTRTN